MNHPNSFGKQEHLCGEITVNRLFTDGKAFIVYPLRVVYIIEEKKNENETALVLISVPKKRFKRAVKRNRIKRLIRECYRLNKQELINTLIENKLNIQLAFNYVSDDMPEFANLEKKICQALHKIIEKIKPFDNQTVS